MSAGEREMMNPVGQVQAEIAGMLAAEPWFKNHAVEVIEQNKQDLKFLLATNLAKLNHVVVVVGVDGITNNHTALECDVTVTCTEHVMANRAKQGAVTAIDACQAAVHVVDGQWWHFTKLSHTTEPGTDTLQAVAYFKGLVNRDFLLNTDKTETANAQEGD